MEQRHSSSKPSVESLCPRVIATEINGRQYHYRRGNYLGRGGFASCFEAIDDENHFTYAAKVIPRSKTDSKPKYAEKLNSEIHIHRSLTHTNIVRCYGHFSDTTNHYILMEKCSLGSLGDMIRTRDGLREEEARSITHQILSGLRYAHSQGVVHRDLKPANIFLTNQDRALTAKIGDLGLAARITSPGQRRHTMCGTPNYIAPEVIGTYYNKRRKQAASEEEYRKYEGVKNLLVPEVIGGHDMSADVWSVAAIIYSMFCVRPPFEVHKNPHQTYVRILSRNIDWETHGRNVPPIVRNLLDSMLTVDPLNRISVDECLQHPWFRSPLVRIPPECARNALNLPTPSGPPPPLVNTRKYGAGFTRPPPIDEDIVRPVTSEDAVYVTAWVDYTNRFGFGYELSDGTIGVHLRDNSAVVLAANGEYMDYYDNLNANSSSGRCVRYSSGAFPGSLTHDERERLEHKRKIVFFFRTYIHRTSVFRVPENLINSHTRDDQHSLTRMYKWHSFRSTGADGSTDPRNSGVMFRLTNKSVQVNFRDHRKAVLCTTSSKVTFVDTNDNKLDVVTFSHQAPRNPLFGKKYPHLDDVYRRAVGKLHEVWGRGAPQ